MAESDPPVAAPDEEADIAAMLDLSKKKKKAKKKKDSKKDKTEKKNKSAIPGVDEAALAEQEALLKEELVAFDNKFPDKYDRMADYEYSDLLDRVIDILTSNDPEFGNKTRRKVEPPQLERVGTKKTRWNNFNSICSGLRRPKEHVLQFCMAELGTEGNIDGSDRLVIRGKYVPKYIESLLRKYIQAYVTCNMCKSADTNLTKDSSTRLQFVNCNQCGSSRSVAAIRTGYHATSRADRRAARNAKG